jgi:ABC-type nitrate/sulfonate/bicarbonate transport system substrate-binding protein
MRIHQSLFVVPAIVEVAQRRGFFAAVDIESAVSLTTSSHAQRADLDAGVVDVAITASDNLFAWNATGSDIAIIAQIESITDLALTVRPGLAELSSVSGLRLAVDAPSNGFAVVAYAMLKRLGLSQGSYNIVEVGGVRERFDALLEGRADVTLLAPPLDELGCRHGMTVAMRVAELSAAYPGLGIVATRKRSRERPELVASYLSALETARSWISGTPVDVVRSELTAAGMGPVAIDSVLATIPERLAPSVLGLQELADLRVQMDMVIAGAPAPAELVDLDPLKRAGLLSPA